MAIYQALLHPGSRIHCSIHNIRDAPYVAALLEMLHSSQFSLSQIEFISNTVNIDRNSKFWGKFEPIELSPAGRQI